VGHTTAIHDPDAMPGTYFHPGASPYTVALPDGLDVQEAYKGQYYVPNPGMTGFGMSPLGEINFLPYDPVICAIVGALAGAGAGFGVAKAMKKKPPLPKKQANQRAVMGAAGGAVVGGIIGYLICGKRKPEVPAPPPGAVTGGLVTPPAGTQEQGGAQTDDTFAPTPGAPPETTTASVPGMFTGLMQAVKLCPPGQKFDGRQCRSICPPPGSPHLDYWDGTQCAVEPPR
jgi:hypothetical protein